MAEDYDVDGVNELSPVHHVHKNAPIITKDSGYAPEADEDDESDEGEGGDDDASGAQAAGAEAAATIAAAAETSPGLNSAPADTAQVDTAQALAAAHAALNAVPTLFGKGDGNGSNSWVVARGDTECETPLHAKKVHPP